MVRRTDIVFKILGTIFVSIGILFLIMSFVFAFILSGGTELNRDDAAALYILLLTFLGIGTIFTIPGLILFLIWRRKEARAARLKSEGICYDAEISDVKMSPYMHYGRYGYYSNSSFTVECWYRNQEGRTCLVKSGGLLLNPLFFGAGKDSLKAKVYVSRDDPRDYYVEVTSAQQSDIQIDNDYR